MSDESAAPRRHRLLLKFAELGASAQAAKMTWASLHGICSLDAARLRMIMDGDLPSTAAHLVDLHIAGYAAQTERSGARKRVKT